MVALGGVLGLLAGLLPISLGAPLISALVAALLGGVLGLVLGQALMWLRSSSGRLARAENKIDAVRTISEKRHEILFKAAREARERGAAARRRSRINRATACGSASGSLSGAVISCVMGLPTGSDQ